MFDHEHYDSRTALVLGASGAIGSAIASALAVRGWTVRGLTYDPDLADLAWPGRRSPMTWVAGDELSRGDVVMAARGAQLIVHVPDLSHSCSRDPDLALRLIDNTVIAARLAGGVRILLPSTIHGFDPATTPVVRENSPQQSRTRRGVLSARIERRLREAVDDAPSLIVRAGELFGPQLRTGWFAQAMVRPGQAVRRIVNPHRGAGHAWAYLPDVAEAMARLLDVPEHLRSFEQIGFGGTWDANGQVMPDAIRAAVGVGPIPERPHAWSAMRMLAPFGGFPREAVDTAATWRHPVDIDNHRLVELLGHEPRTPLVRAVRLTLIGLGCKAAFGAAPFKGLNPTSSSHAEP